MTISNSLSAEESYCLLLTPLEWKCLSPTSSAFPWLLRLQYENSKNFGWESSGSVPRWVRWSQSQLCAKYCKHIWKLVAKNSVISSVLVLKMHYEQYSTQHTRTATVDLFLDMRSFGCRVRIHLANIPVTQSLSPWELAILREETQQ